MPKPKKPHPGLTAAQRDEFLESLEARFTKNKDRHPSIAWADVQKRLLANETKLAVLYQMEQTGGEPDVVAKEGTAFVFMDCCEESPKGRRSLCYDRQGWESRKEHRPDGNAMDSAKAMGAQLLTEADYRTLQQSGVYDAKTSTWVHTPEDVRALGGALFCDYRYGRVFVYHNGAQSYYASRGFRCKVQI